MGEQFVNDDVYTMTADITSVSTTLIVSSTYVGLTPDLAGGSIRVLVDNELMYVTAIAGTSWTVVRGAEGSTATTHTNGTTVYIVNTAGSMLQRIADNRQFGTYSARPGGTSTGPGQVYHQTDGPYTWVGAKGSGVWSPYGPIYPLTQPPLSGWGQVNFTAPDASVDYTRGVPILSSPGPSSGGGSDNYAILTQPVTATVGQTQTFDVKLTSSVSPPYSNNRSFGITFRVSSTGWQYLMQANLGPSIGSYIFVGNSYISTIQGFVSIDPERMRFMRGTIQVNSPYDVITYSLSADGENWIQFAQTSCPYGNPDTFGFFINPNASGASIAVACTHLLVH